MAIELTDERTFLFTDVEGSSARWNRDEQGMSEWMTRHDEAIAHTVAAHRGLMIGGEGDSSAAMFASPLEALEAAGDIQLALSDPASDVDLQVRMGIHSGRVYRLAEGRFGGAPLNYLGRLHRAGHGGQILVSDVTADLLMAGLPPGWELRDLGEHTLRDFSTRRIFQACHDQLRRAFPPLSATRPFTLPASPDTSFVGRTQELKFLSSVLRHRVTSLTGPGGIGKTRLALELAARLADRYRDGVCVLELSGVRDPSQASLALATALHVDPLLERSVEDSIERSLRNRSMLVVLDNCEHLAATAARLADLLGALPNIDVLATSRVPLGAADEQIVPLQPLRLPDPASDSPAQIRASEAVRLFTDRARLVRPDFVLDEQTSRLVADICSRVSGLPLAIELAAGRLRTSPLRDVRDDVGQPMSGAPRAWARARASIDWSVDTLSPDELELFGWLAVFPGGAPRRMIERIRPARSELVGSVAPVLERLVARSLVQFEESAAGGQYRLLEPMRLAMLDRMDPGTRIELDARHADVVSELAIGAEPRLLSRGEAAAVDDLDRLYPSLRVAIDHDTVDDPGRAARVLVATHEYCFLRMRYEMYSWVNQLLERGGLQPEAESDLCGISGLGAFNRGDLRTARARCERSLAVAAACGYDPLVYAHFGLMAAYGFESDFARAQASFVSAMTWCTAHEHDYFLVNTLVLAAMAMTIQGDSATAAKLAMNALETAERSGSPSAIAWALCALADAERLHSPGAAHVHLDEALETARGVNSRWIEGQALMNLARLQWQSSPVDSAAALITALANAEQTGSPIQARQALRLSMLLLGRLGCDQVALLLQASARRDATALPAAPDEAEGMDRLVRQLTGVHGSEVVGALEGRGRRMPDHELLSLARQALANATTGGSAAGSDDPGLASR